LPARRKAAFSYELLALMLKAEVSEIPLGCTQSGATQIELAGPVSGERLAAKG